MLVFTVSFLFPFFLTYIDSLFSVVWRTAPKGATEPLARRIMKVYRTDRAVWQKIQAVLFTFGRFCDIIKAVRKLIYKLEFVGGLL